MGSNWSFNLWNNNATINFSILMVFCWFLKGTEIWIHIKSIEQNLFLLCLFLYVIVSDIIGKKLL